MADWARLAVAWLVIGTLGLIPTASVSMSAEAQGYLQQTPGVGNPEDLDRWRGDEDVAPLEKYPPAPPGTPNPQQPLYRFGGHEGTSYGLVELGMPFSMWMSRMKAQRQSVDRRARTSLEARFSLECRKRDGITMSRGKPQPIGPVAQLPRGVDSWEAYAALGPDTILERGDFPYTPLDHPIHSTAHMLFPQLWVSVHPEHERFDVSFDIPDCFLPEFPPPLYLTTHPELGDVTRGAEIAYGNYFQMFDGLITAEQMEGLRLLVTPFQTTWFNVTQHRVTEQPSQGVACFSCHVNGHTNAAFELAPDSRPNYARLRVDTPTMRGNYAQHIFSSKRSIRSMDHFAEVEEYFDGDTALAAAIGGRTLQKPQTNRMGDFNAIIDFPPAEKLDVRNRLLPDRATPAELRGEALFHGKALCAECHPAAQHFTDQNMHDLQVERFYGGRPEGPIKTFPLRGIKDSPPYLHDGRLLTLEDAVIFFDLILDTRLTAAEMADLTAYLRAL
jgi:cytochrome c peroxidase